MTGRLLITVFAAVVCVRSQEHGEHGTAPAILAMEEAWFEGESRNDNHALDLIFDNDLVYIEQGKPLTKGEYLSRIRLAGPHSQQVVLEGSTVRTFGSSAVVVGVYREKSVKDGRTLLNRWRFVDTWVHERGTWMLVAAGSSRVADK
ncbi:MAG: hypothetical protein JWQ87_4018 [Candidatus Sulfotelmatobacter sp.]|nr:hypothetical protein [Candidatus Sulfotelmatobacter sp.]